MEAALRSQALVGVLAGEVALGAEQRDLLGDRVRHVLVQHVRDGVDRILGHHAIGRVLTSGDRDQARNGMGDDVLARELAGLVGLVGEQRTQAGVDALDVVETQRRDDVVVDVVEQVLDVGLRRGRVLEVELPVGVGRADDPVAAPRDHEQHALLGADRERG